MKSIEIEDLIFQLQMQPDGISWCGEDGLMSKAARVIEEQQSIINGLSMTIERLGEKKGEMHPRITFYPDVRRP